MGCMIITAIMTFSVYCRAAVLFCISVTTDSVNPLDEHEVRSLLTETGVDRHVEEKQVQQRSELQHNCWPSHDDK